MALVVANANLTEQAQKREGRGAFAAACKLAADALADVPQDEKAPAMKAIEAAQAWIKGNSTATVATMEEKMKDMKKSVDPVTLKLKLDSYCKEVKESMNTKNFEADEKDKVEKALSECDATSAKTTEEYEAKLKALGDAVNPVMVQVNKRSGGVTGDIVYLKDGTSYFKANNEMSKARLLLEESTGVFFIDLDEVCDDNSLACLMEDVQSRLQQGVKKCQVCVLSIEARADHPALHGHLMRSGAFMVALKAMQGIPIIGVVSGRVAGPAWSLLLACDYRIAVIGTKFHLPICSAPDCIQKLVGPMVATELCLSTSTLDCHACLELALLTQGRPTIEEAKYAAYEQAKRIAGFPRVGLRCTVPLLNPAAQLYVNALADDPSIMAQVYPEDVVTNN